jgi:hypothetical protein
MTFRPATRFIITFFHLRRPAGDFPRRHLRPPGIPQARHRPRLLEAVAKIGMEIGGGRFEWIALRWNENAFRFYRSLGAKVMDEWALLRMNSREVGNLVRRESEGDRVIELLPGREKQVVHTGGAGGKPAEMACGKNSTAGSVSQRACVFCGSRVVLYPIADALHIVHGPIGCAAYTWDIRGALSSGPQLHRNSFSTDLQEMDVIFGGEKKLEAALLELIAHHSPKAAFVYSTCIVGLIGDDVSAVCKRVAAKTGIPVLGVHSEGFKGTKKDGYKAACDALYKLIGTGDISRHQPAQHQHSRRIQSCRRNVDSARLLQAHGHRGRRRASPATRGSKTSAARTARS